MIYNFIIRCSESAYQIQNSFTKGIILSKIVPKLSRILTFEKQYYGPYSEDLQELIDNPLYYDGAYVYNSDGSISLTEYGKKIFNKIVEENKGEPRFNQFINLLTLTRKLYDKLTQEELLFLVYITYPEFRDHSEILERLLSNGKRKEIARSLLEKGLITEERYNEIIEE